MIALQATVRLTFILLALASGMAVTARASSAYQCMEGPASCPGMARCIPADCSPGAECFNRAVQAFSEHRRSISSNAVCLSGAITAEAIATRAAALLDFADAAENNLLDDKLPSLTYGGGVKGYKDRSIVVVHGSYGVPGFMDDFVEKYAGAGYNVVNCRLSGHGQDDEALKQVTVEDWRSDVRYCYDIAKRVGREVELLGHSLGASLIADLAIREAELRPDSHPIKHMYLLDPPIRFRGGARWLGLRPGTGVMCKPVEKGKIELMSDLGLKTQSEEQRMARYRETVPSSCGLDDVPPYNKQQYVKILCEIRKLMLNHPIRTAQVDIPTSIFSSDDNLFSEVFAIPNSKWLARHLGPEVAVYKLPNSVHPLMTIAACNGSFDQMWQAMRQPGY